MVDFEFLFLLLMRNSMAWAHLTPLSFSFHSYSDFSGESEKLKRKSNPIESRVTDWYINFQKVNFMHHNDQERFCPQPSTRRRIFKLFHHGCKSKTRCLPKPKLAQLDKNYSAWQRWWWGHWRVIFNQLLRIWDGRLEKEVYWWMDWRNLRLFKRWGKKTFSPQQFILSLKAASASFQTINFQNERRD